MNKKNLQKVFNDEIIANQIPFTQTPINRQGIEQNLADETLKENEELIQMIEESKLSKYKHNNGNGKDMLVNFPTDEELKSLMDFRGQIRQGWTHICDVIFPFSVNQFFHQFFDDNAEFSLEDFGKIQDRKNIVMTNWESRVYKDDRKELIKMIS